MRDRVWATVAIWAAFATAAVALVAVFANRTTQLAGGITLFSLMALLVAGAVAGTRVVWHSRCQEYEDMMRARHADQRRIERLAETYSAEELRDTQRETVITRRTKE